YTSLGLGPAMVKLLSDAAATTAGAPVATANAPVAALAVDDDAEAKPLIAYDSAAPAAAAPADAIARVYSTGEQLAVALGIVGLALTVIYAINFYRIHEIGANYSEAAALLVASFGIGTVLRLVSDAPSGLLQ